MNNGRLPHDLCNEHSAVCVRLENIEDDMRNNRKKIDAIIYLLVVNLATVAVTAIFLYLKGL